MCIGRGWDQGGEKREAAKVGSCECERRNMGSSREIRNSLDAAAVQSRAR